jgi:type II secretory pathway pseudopilin PulG
MGLGRRCREGGFSYVAVLAMVALMGLGLSAIAPLWAEETRREREDDLLRVGLLYAEALANYQRASPGSAKRYPPTLEVLLLDTRFVGTVRHLRELYADPIDPSRPWGLVRDAEGGILGVFSQSDATPLRAVPVRLSALTLAPARRYSDWQFVARND